METLFFVPISQILWVNEEAIPTSPVSPLPSDPFFGGGEDGIISDVTSGGTNKLPTRPQHTSPDANFASEVSIYHKICKTERYGIELLCCNILNSVKLIPLLLVKVT